MNDRKVSGPNQGNYQFTHVSRNKMKIREVKSMNADVMQIRIRIRIRIGSAFFESLDPYPDSDPHFLESLDLDPDPYFDPDPKLVFYFFQWKKLIF